MSDPGESAAPAPTGAVSEGVVEQPAAGNGLFDQDLQELPEELRPWGEKIAQNFSKRVDGKFREHADFRKQFEAYEGLSLPEREELEALIEFNQTAQDPQAFKEWLSQVASHPEIGGHFVASEDDWSRIGEENGWAGGEGLEGGEGDDPMTQQLQSLADTVENLQQQIAQQAGQAELQQTEAQVTQELEGMLNDLKGSLGDGWTEDIENEVIGLAQLYSDDDNPFQKAYEHYTRLTGGAQAELLDGKLESQNGASLQGGQVDTTPQNLTDAERKQAAKARFSAARVA